MLLLPSLTDNLDSHKEMSSLAGGGIGSILYLWQWKLAQVEQDIQMHDMDTHSLLTWPLCMPPSAEGQQKKSREATYHEFG